MAQQQFYATGKKAVDLNSDGTGYIYYPNGKVAVAISNASDYQNSFYAFDNNRQSTVLLAIDELAVGFATSSTRKSQEVEKRIIVMSKVGCVVSSEGRIIHEWTWDRGSINAGVEPSENILSKLNENLEFLLRDRKNLTLTFTCDGISQSLDLGAKVRREDNYLQHCQREPGGRILPLIDRKTLKERQEELSETFRAQRNKLHPKSENLSEMVRDIVQGLEHKFDSAVNKIATSPCLGSSWKESSRSATLREIPRIPITGLETGLVCGFGKFIYEQPKDIDFSKTLPANLVDKKGNWKNNVEIRSALREVNPPLSRSWILNANSGRYSDMMVIDKAAVTPDNPTGMVVPVGKPLRNIDWKHLKSTLSENGSSSANANTPLTVVLLLRGGEPTCCVYERIAEVVNHQLDVEFGSSVGSTAKSATPASGTRGFRPSDNPLDGTKLYRLDVGESNEIVDELGIKHLPTFLMFQGSRLVYAGVIGGRKQKTFSSTNKPQILLVEPEAKYQIVCEKTLRQHGCDTFLCLSIQEAIERLRQFSVRVGSNKPTLVFDLILISDKLQGGELNALMKLIGEDVATKRTIISALVSVLGQEGPRNLCAVTWHDAFSEEVSKVVSEPLASVAQYVIQKPVKAMAIDQLLARQHHPSEEESLGLTPGSLMATIVEVRKGALGVGGGGRVMSLRQFDFGPKTNSQYVGIRLSAEDAKMKGVPLTR